jgi:hypothetical protein
MGLIMGGVTVCILLAILSGLLKPIRVRSAKVGKAVPALN